MREARHVAAVVVVGSSRRNPKTRKQVIECTLMQHVAFGNTAVVVIVWLDLYTVVSAALHGRQCSTRAW